MLLFLARHGESVFNAEARVQGQLNVPLSELGRRQAEALAEAFASFEIEALFASPLARAWQTAEPVAARLGLPLVADERLREIHAGVFQGELLADLPTKFPEVHARWRAAEPDYAIPEGESRLDLLRRAEAVVRDLAARNYRRVGVVSHGGLLASILKSSLGVPASRQPFTFHNASLTRLELGPPVKLVTLNETEHLHRAGCAPALGSRDL
jgi:2,3-bisphosphoglycerate-dependent phosphoglycerate mutase